MFTKKNLSEKGRHKLYVVLDCETATLPFANEIAKTAKEKKDICIAKPLIYDIGWTIVDSDMNLYEKRSFLVTETFAVPQIFNTAYYKEKRPIYLDRLNKKETILKTWQEITEILFSDLKQVNFCCAFNAMFDFKKAVPFTEQYIYHLYNNDYQDWENLQRQICQRIVRGSKSENTKGFDPNNFQFKGIDFPIIDLWGVACESLINNVTYKRGCLENKMITESGKFFKTSAEATYRYLQDRYDFVEAHTAIDDAEIESLILHKALKKGKITLGIVYFPFQMLGTTESFLKVAKRGIKKEHFELVITTIHEKLKTYERESGFTTELQNMESRLMSMRDDRF